MRGGVGRYTFNLVKSLRSRGLQVLVACNEQGDGDFYELAPGNEDNYKVLLKLVDKVNPDLVHIQYEPGLYGLELDSLNRNKTHTNIDLFYNMCSVPIVTTFHTTFNFKQWMSIAIPIKRNKIGTFSNWGSKLIRYWTHFLNYHSFHELNRRKLRKSAGGIVFSQYMKNKVGGGTIAYHGAEPIVPFYTSKELARSRFSLPQGGRIALAVGFRTATKGWDIFEKMRIPKSWTIVTNSSKNHYNIENLNPKFKHSKMVVNLNMDFLNDTELSLLFHAADVVLLPYKVSSGSGVMFDALAHGLPFIASDLEFFREFSSMGLGITVKRTPNAFTHALLDLDDNYTAYSKAVESFKARLKWDYSADIHIQLYENIMKNISLKALQRETQRRPHF
jgi:glycosyltransferase involved in cell wall biosynthesis